MLFAVASTTVPVVAAETTAAGGGSVTAAPTVPTVEAWGTDWAEVAAGTFHTCARKTSGRLYCWGKNGSAGGLGDGTTTQRSTPTEVAGGATDWAEVTTSHTFDNSHACARKTNGRLYCWGLNVLGELGDGTVTNRLTPTEVAGGATDWAQVTAGSGHTCARKTNGRLYCWGHNDNGQLGDGTNTGRLTPTEVAGGATDWAQVTAGSGHTCARKTNGRLYCWGSNPGGRLGDGTTTQRLTPTEVAGGATDWAEVTTKNDYTCARKTNGRLYCWGSNLSWGLGVGTGPNRLTPTEVAGGATDWAQVTAGWDHTCARKTNGRLYCWGSNNTGRLGDGTTTSRSTPTEVAGGATDWAQVAAGLVHTCARKTNGRLYCWGTNFHGELGDGTTTTQRLTPTEVAGAKVDGEIRRGAETTFVGDAVYNTTASGQSRTSSVRRGNTGGFVMRFRNEASATDTIRFQGPGNSTGFTVQYLAGTVDVTAAVVAGTFEFEDLAANATRNLKVKVTVAANATVNSTKTVKVTATSVGDPTKRDAVKATVTAIR